ncbi:TolC family protein [bacterium]|nr:TolC family protein [bacterium]
MKKFFLIIVALFLVSSGVQAIEDCGCEHHHHFDTAIKVKDGTLLNVRDCISIGVNNSPVIKEYAHRLEIAKSNVGIAKSAYFPEFSAGAGFRQEFNSNRNEFARNYSEIPTVGISLNKMIWDFGKTTANVKMEEFFKIAAEYEFEDIICQTVFNIKIAYYELLKAKSHYEAHKTYFDIQNNLVKDIQKLVKSGQKDNADLINAKLILIKTKTQLIEAENDYKIAKENLNNAIYLKNAPDYSVYATDTFNYKPAKQTVYSNVYNLKNNKSIKDDTIFQHPNYSYNKAVEIAYKNSPDIKALVATRNAFEQALVFVKRSYYPSLNAGVGYDFLNTNHYNNNGLSVAVTIDSTINGMRQKYDLKGANAQLNLANTEIETFKDNLYFTVRKCLNNVNSTYKNLPANREKMSIAAKNFELTYNNYKSNQMNQLELENSVQEYFNSLIDYINSQFDYNISLIRLEMAMHEHLIDYHDDAEHAADFHEGNENDALSKLIRCNKKHKP